MLKYREINCKSALNKVDNEYGFCYDLNIYRGCIHKCYYCFAIYSHKYIDSKDFFGEIFVKKNIAEVLEKELSSRNWNRDIINLGSVTDNYQEAEKDYKLMRDVLKLFIRYKTPMCISTKSDLILRDFDLIDELSSIVPVRIASTITTLDEKLSALVEPNVISPKKRFEMLGEFKKTKAIVAVHTMPVMPFITENRLEDIFKTAKEYGIDYCAADALKLRGECRKIYLNFIRQKFPQYYKKYLYIYGNDGLLKDEYRKKLYSKIRVLEEKYSITYKTKEELNTENSIYNRYKNKVTEEEPSLF